MEKMANGQGTQGLRRREESVEEYFWGKVEKTDICWFWRGSVLKSGYGQAYSRGKTWRAHRLAWTITHGPIPKGASVLHRCDRPLCVRPDHLFLGSQKDNIADAMEKGRLVAPPIYRGEQNPKAKLTSAQVATIRESDEASSVVALRFGISDSHVRTLRRGIRNLWTTESE